MTCGKSLWRRTAALTAAAGLAALPAAAQGAPAPPRIAEGPAFVQVVVPLQGPAVAAIEGQVEALDPSPANGRAVVRVTRPGVVASTTAVTRRGVRVRAGLNPGGFVVVLTAPRGRFSFLSYATTVGPPRLVIRLWTATTDAAARILDDGCLRLTRWSGGRAGVASARGLELVPLFEHALVLSLRAEGRGGSTIAQRPITAIEGVFRPDFSGYLTPGTWRGRLPYAVPAPRRAMLQAWSTSARDGALDCLVQTPVIRRPR